MNTKQHGFTLVETMIAMTLGLFLLGGMISALMTSKSAARSQSALFNIQENARFVLEAMKKDIRTSDNWGCTQSTTNLLTPANQGYVDYLNQSVVGLDGGFDTLTIRRAQNVGFALNSNMATAFSNIDVGNASTLSQGDIVVISDCSGGDIFQISNNVSVDGFVSHTTGGNQPGNVSSDFSKAYTTSATVYKIYDEKYSVVTVSGVNWLQRVINGGTPEMLTPNVAGFQITYGVDTDTPTDNSANVYLPITSITNTSKIVSVRVNLLLQSEENNVTINNMTYTFNGVTTTASDKRLYKSYVATVSIRNRQKR